METRTLAETARMRHPKNHLVPKAVPPACFPQALFPGEEMWRTQPAFAAKRRHTLPTSPTLSCFALVASSRNIATPALAPARCTSRSAHGLCEPAAGERGLWQAPASEERRADRAELCALVRYGWNEKDILKRLLIHVGSFNLSLIFPGPAGIWNSTRTEKSTVLACQCALFAAWPLFSSYAPHKLFSFAVTAHASSKSPLSPIHISSLKKTWVRHGLLEHFLFIPIRGTAFFQACIEKQCAIKCKYLNRTRSRPCSLVAPSLELDDEYIVSAVGCDRAGRCN